MKIVVASQNPAKIEAVRMGFTRVFPNDTLEIEGVSVPSGVADQPMSDTETLLGATNRANNAHDAVVGADFYVGLEGGLEQTEHGLCSVPWIVVRQGDRYGRGSTGRYFLPEAISKLVLEGKELGEADDIVFNRKNSKQSDGAIGILSKGLCSRTDAFVHAIVLALIPFMNPELYSD